MKNASNLLICKSIYIIYKDDTPVGFTDDRRLLYAAVAGGGQRPVSKAIYTVDMKRAAEAS